MPRQDIKLKKSYPICSSKKIKRENREMYDLKNKLQYTNNRNFPPSNLDTKR